MHSGHQIASVKTQHLGVQNSDGLTRVRFAVSCLANAVTGADVQKRDRLLEVDKGCFPSGL